jgi:predicted phosphoadenosine phosphosulfate sulfurtransferase
VYSPPGIVIQYQGGNTVVLRNEEIMVPGTYEYAERTAARPEISFNWLVPRMPVMNICNRHMPYFWSFDPTIPEEDWVRKFPEMAYEIPEQHIGFMVTHDRFPPPPGKDLINVIGLRASESVNRRLAMFSSGGFLTYPDPHTKVRKARPIYDWNEPDVWLAIKKFQWDYNRAYDTFWQLGMTPSMLRIGPPTINIHAIKAIPYFAKAWPHWFDRVCHRLPGVRRVAQFGV